MGVHAGSDSLSVEDVRNGTVTIPTYATGGNNEFRLPLTIFFFQFLC